MSTRSVNQASKRARTPRTRSWGGRVTRRCGKSSLRRPALKACTSSHPGDPLVEASSQLRCLVGIVLAGSQPEDEPERGDNKCDSGSEGEHIVLPLPVHDLT